MGKPLKAALKAIKPALVPRPAPLVVAPPPPPEPTFREQMRGVIPLPPDGRVHFTPARPSPNPQQRRDPPFMPADANVFASWFDEQATDAEWLDNGTPRDTLKKLRQHHWPLAGWLDLHGHDRDEAQTRLALFLHQSVQKGWRCVCVIHGQGYGSAAGAPVLRPMVRAQLARHPDVLAYCAAPPRDGGDGALLVLLRRHI